jgi:hypothetical protein
VVDNAATHKHPQGQSVARAASSLDMSFHATSGSWLNAVENFFSVLTRALLRTVAFIIARRYS